MLRRNLIGGTIRPTKKRSDFELTAGHVEHLGGGVNDLIVARIEKLNVMNSTIAANQPWLPPRPTRQIPAR